MTRVRLRRQQGIADRHVARDWLEAITGEDPGMLYGPVCLVSEERVMSFRKAIHVVCDHCGTVLENADCGKWIAQRAAIVAMRRKGWSHGKQDLCPRCRTRAKKAVPTLFETVT